MKTISDFNVLGKRVFLRCDFNIPLSAQGDVLDDFRVMKTLPTIKHLSAKGAKVILASHLGRPNGVRQEALSLAPVYEILVRHLSEPIIKADECIGEKVKKRIEELPEGGILLLENLRFQKEEEENDKGFARELADLADIYINEAFGVSHRAHASIVGVPEFLPSGIGLLFEQELKAFSKVLDSPQRPLVGVIGGTKKNKLECIQSISRRVDTLLVGGKIAELAKEGSTANNVILSLDGVQEDKQVLDIGPKTVKTFVNCIKSAKTIFWAGPLGKIEEKRFRTGTLAIAEAIANSKVESIAGGRETVDFIRDSGLENKFSHLSTGGGAMLDYLSDGTLPGIEAVHRI